MFKYTKTSIDKFDNIIPNISQLYEKYCIILPIITKRQPYPIFAETINIVVCLIVILNPNYEGTAKRSENITEELIPYKMVIKLIPN